MELAKGGNKNNIGITVADFPTMKQGDLDFSALTMDEDFTYIPTPFSKTISQRKTFLIPSPTSYPNTFLVNSEFNQIVLDKNYTDATL